MRRTALLLALTVSVLSLSACGMLSDDEAPATTKAAPAAAAAPSAAMKASASEEKEMAAVMGDEAPAPDAVPVEPVTAEATDATNPTDPIADLQNAAAAPTDITSADHAAAPAPENRTPVSGAPSECPGVEVLPDTKSITYFDDPEGKPLGAMIARASLVDIKGGCDYTADGLIVDIDMIMQGKITDKGRYEGRSDLEAFMTFPYFVAIMDPSGKMVDKKIMATAMRFKPGIDDLDHAEKITQTIPLANLQDGPKYTITVGFQLNRAQLDYNRGSVSAPAKNVKPGTKKAAEPAAPHEDNKPKKPAEKTSDNPLSGAEGMVKKADSKPASAPADAPKAEGTSSETPSTSGAAPAPAGSSGSKMKPIAE